MVAAGCEAFVFIVRDVPAWRRARRSASCARCSPCRSSISMTQP